MVEQQEKTLWASHPFLWKYFWWILLAYIFFTIILILAIWVYILVYVSLIAYALLCIPLLMQFIRWKRIYYKLTDERVIIKLGILNIHEKSIMVDKIENFEVKQNIVDRILGTGDIVFFTEGELHEGELDDVPHVRDVEDILADLLGRRTP